MSIRSLISFLVLSLAAIVSTSAVASTASVETTWRLLDYIAVDYAAAVQDGRVISQAEFDEMLEFSATAADSIGALSEAPGLQELKDGARMLSTAIQAKAAPTAVSDQARALAAALVRVYPILLAPDSAPIFANGKVQYAQLCASCHGATGGGDGPASAGLDPAPIDFTDRERADERSVFALYQVIKQGLEGTSMVSYGHLPAADIWALATYVGALAYPESEANKGKEVIDRKNAQGAPFDMQQYVSKTPATMIAELGPVDGAAVVAHLRRHPETLTQVNAEAKLALARNLLKQSVAAYEGGDAVLAKDLALSAYLDGFEPLEPLLSARDNALMIEIETAMARLRGSVARPGDVTGMRVQAAALDTLFERAEDVLYAESASAVTSFLAAFTILLREGLEAMLIVVAMIAMLKKAGRNEMLPWVHAGWASALLAGLATWVAATWVISISGASRELAEGLGSLFAAVMLVWVGIWMHGKSHADAWQRYVREHLSRALSRKSGIFLAALIFVVVYREVFETILFYAALWTPGNETSVVSGGVVASLVLAVIGWQMMRYSRKLPLALFFKYSSWLIAVLAVVLAGKAVSALQEAGYLPITLLENGLRIDLLGIYPTFEGLGAQFVVLLVLLIGFARSGKKS
jgi:high-affinity iron transporter